MEKLLELINQIDKLYIIIGLGVLFFIILLTLIIKIVSRKKRQKKQENEVKEVDKENVTESYVYNPLKNKQEEKIESNLTIKNNTIGNKKEKKVKKEKKSRKEKKFELEFNKEKEICINAYNQLYGVYVKEGYSVDLQNNNVLAYYTSLIENATTIEELKNISSTLSYQTVKIIDEIKYVKQKEHLEKQRKFLYDECVLKIAELKKLFSVLNLSGESTIQEFNNRLVAYGMFAKLEDYQLIYNDLIQNIEFVKERYKDTLNSLTSNDETIIDVKLIESLKILNCKLDETNLSTIKTNYINLVKKYHPDTNNDSIASIEMSSKINEAYNYVRKALTKNQKK